MANSNMQVDGIQGASGRALPEDTANRSATGLIPFTPDQALETVSDYYGRTRDWITGNLGGRNLTVVGVVGVAGLLGFFLGRRKHGSLD